MFLIYHFCAAGVAMPLRNTICRNAICRNAAAPLVWLFFWLSGAKRSKIDSMFLFHTNTVFQRFSFLKIGKLESWVLILPKIKITKHAHIILDVIQYRAFFDFEMKRIPLYFFNKFFSFWVTCCVYVRSWLSFFVGPLLLSCHLQQSVIKRAQRGRILHWIKSQ